MTMDSRTTLAVFDASVKQELIPNRYPGDIVVMDNLSTHKNSDIIDTIKRAGADVLFLPPYSPEFNPIEKVWSKIKAIIRRVDTMAREAFDSAVSAAMNQITATDIKNWTTHAGYSIN